MTDKNKIVAIIQDGLKDGKEIESSYELAEQHQWDHQLVISALKQLEAKEKVVTTPKQFKKWVRTPAGERTVKDGSSQIRFVQAVPEEGITKQELMGKFDKTEQRAFGQCMRSKWIRLDRDSGKVFRNVNPDELEDKDQTLLKKPTNELSAQELKSLKQGKYLMEKLIKYVGVKAGPTFGQEDVSYLHDLNVEALKSGSWKKMDIKPMNFNSRGPPLVVGGHLHPLQKVKEQFRQLLLELGFQEMPTNQYVESSFWNYDSLFQPQQHPCRDAHDTFFLDEPKYCQSLPENYWEKVKDTHEKGTYCPGSIGWRYDWSVEESKKNILRTHTTAVSARMLYALAQQKGEFKPVRYFSIDRVFRNEALDATHLAEFCQIEGLIADFDLTLGHLIGMLRTFYERIGITQLRFKPGYNPYTEPSMEVFGYHPYLKKWVEVGNSGIFRPEMLEPMGLPPGVRVIAWGLGLERPTMIKYNIANIRDLVGHKLDLDFITQNPICRLEKH